jgi:DNA-binding phage protein
LGTRIVFSGVEIRNNSRKIRASRFCARKNYEAENAKMTERRIESAADWIGAVVARIEERDLTYAQVEHDAQLGEGYLAKLLSGRKTPTLPPLQRVLGALGLSLALTTAAPQETHHE